MTIETKYTPEEIEARLAQHIGSQSVYRYFGNIVITEGVKDMADICGAYWLLDIAVSYQCEENVQKESFQVWSLNLHEHDDGAIVTLTDGNYNEILTQDIPYTDFPLQRGITLWLIDRTLLLPSEY